MAIRTQKAQGISMLASRFNDEIDRATNPLRRFKLSAQPFIVLQPETTISAGGEPTVDAAEAAKMETLVRFEMDRRGWRFPLFARPCPTTPRHGFVDSRRVGSFSEVVTVILQTVAADPQGEVVLMPVVAADLSAVVTSAGIGIGPGNDGATAGVGSVNYTIATAKPSAALLTDARIDHADDAYFEVVLSGTDARLVQMRGGPQLGAAVGNYVPHGVYVLNVLKAEGDALEWEAKMKQFGAAGSSETVVWHPGGWRGSHFAVHAILNKVPVVFDEIQPSRYSTLEPSDETKVPDYDSDAIAAGIAAGLAADLSKWSGRHTGSPDLLGFAATCVHGAPSMRTGASAEMMGAGLAVLLRLSIAACIGEYRHKTSSGLSSDRNAVYSDTLDRFDALTRKRFARAMTSFANEKWSSAFGGAAWARCAMMAADLESALVDILQSRGGRMDIGKAVARAHRLLNAAHNTGTLLNKFGDPVLLDSAAAGNRWLALAAVTLWHRQSIVASASRLVWMMREVFAMDEIAAKARKFWDSERGAFLEMEEAIERALTTKNGKRRKAGEIVTADVPPFLAHYCAAGWNSISVQVARSNESDRVVRRPKIAALPKNIYGRDERPGRRPMGRPYTKRIVEMSNPSGLVARATLGTRRSFAGSTKQYYIAETELSRDMVRVYAVLNNGLGGTERVEILSIPVSEIM